MIKNTHIQRIILFIATMWLAHFHAEKLSAQAKFEFDMMIGSTLIALPDFTYVYEVNVNGETYDFIVDVTEIEENGERTFNYQMTNDKGTSGTVKIAAEAMEYASKQFNYFAGGNTNLTDMTSVWVSKAVYNDLLDYGKATISPDGGGKNVELDVVFLQYDFTAYNAISEEMMPDLSYIYATDSSGEHSYWIHGNPHNPLILKMDIGFTITLKEIRSSGR